MNLTCTVFAALHAFEEPGDSFFLALAVDSFDPYMQVFLSTPTRKIQRHFFCVAQRGFPVEDVDVNHSREPGKGGMPKRSAGMLIPGEDMPALRLRMAPLRPTMWKNNTSSYLRICVLSQGFAQEGLPFLPRMVGKCH